jgi:hypothetical protein
MYYTNTLHNVCIARGRNLICNLNDITGLKTQNVTDAVNVTANTVQETVFEEVHIDHTEEVL